MKRFLLVSTVTLSLMAGSYPASAQADVAQAELIKGASFMQSGNADAAERSFQKAYDSAIAVNDQAKICQAALQLGIVQTTLHKTVEAEKAFQKGLQIAQSVMPPNSPFAALTMCLLADLYFTENRASEAEPLYERGIPNLPPTPPALAAEKTINLALCYMREDKMDSAERMFEKGIAAFSKISGPDGAETMNATVNYATFQFERGNDAKAAELAERVLNSKVEGKVFKASANNVLAHVYNRQEKFGKAMHIAQQSLNEFRNSKSTDAVREAEALLTIGRIYKDGHKYRDAEVAINKAVDLLSKAPDNPDFSDALREKGDLFIRQGQYEKAETLINQSKSLREKYLGAEHSDVAQNLADLGYIYQQENKFADAESAYQHALKIYKKARSESHPLYVSTLAKLAELYKQMGKKAESENTLNSVLEIRRSSLPAGNTSITDTIVSLADVYKDERQTEKATKLLTEALARADQSGADPAKKAAVMQELAAVQAAEGKGEQAADTRRKAEAIVSGLPGAGAAPTLFAASTAPTQSVKQDASVGEKWSLCVGISNFKDSSINLKYSAKDATDFRNFLITKGNFKPDHVKLLVDEAATRQNLIDQLGDSWLAKQVKPEDLVIVYISSHGSQALDEAKGVNFLVTYDTNKSSLLATGIPMQWLSKIISEQVKCKRTVILLDVCHSGSAADWTDDSSNSTGIAGGDAPVGGKELRRMLKSDPQSVVPGSGQVIFCSSSKSQTSWESKEYPNGVFTKRLMDSLNVNGAQTKLGDVYSPLKANVESEVLRDRGEVQTPQVSGNWQGSLLAPLSAH